MIATDTTLDRARAAFLAEDYQSARRLLMTLLPEALDEERRVERTALLARCLQAIGGGLLARELIESEMERAPNDPHLLVAAAEIYAEQGQVEEAESALRRALRFSRDPNTIRCTLANFLAEEGRFEEALEHFSLVLDQEKGHYDASFGRAHALEALGRSEEALEAWEELIRHHPADADGWIFLGIARSNRGQLATALQAFERAASLDPMNISAYYNRAVVESRLGRLAEIQSCAEAIFSIDPEDPRAALVRSWAAGDDRREARRYALEAAQAAITAVELDEEDADIFLASSLTRLAELRLDDDFARVFERALKAERVGFESLLVHREHTGAFSKNPRCFRMLLDFIPSAQLASVLSLRHGARAVRRLDVISSSERRARRMACEMERLSGSRSPRVIKVFAIDIADTNEPEGVLFRSPAASADEIV